jgi:hypothetical protein
MLCRRWLFCPLFGRGFADESVLAHFLADAWPPWLRWSTDALPLVLLDACLSALGGYFATKALSFV